MTVIIHKREESVKKIRLVLFSIYIIADRGLKTRFFEKIQAIDFRISA